MLPKLPTKPDPVEPDSAAPGPVEPDPVEPDLDEPGSAALDPDEPASTAPTVQDTPAAEPGPGELADRPGRARVLIAVAVVAVTLIAGAVVLAIANHAARADGPLGNEAFVDAAGTAEVVGQVTAAMRTVYSYDYRTLDANQAAANGVITGRFADGFDKVFTPLKQLAPREQAVLTTTVPAAGVLQLRGDRARLLMMVDQRGTRGGSRPIAEVSARLVVEAQRTGGRWKIAEVTPE